MIYPPIAEARGSKLIFEHSDPPSDPAGTIVRFPEIFGRTQWEGGIDARSRAFESAEGKTSAAGKQLERPFEQAQEAIRQENARKRREYEVELARHEAKVRRLLVEDKANPGSSWLSRMRDSSRVRRLERQRPRPPVHKAVPTRFRIEKTLTLWASAGETAKLTAGIEGEEKVANGLAQVLSDEWTLFRGYRNRRGEIDQLLLGPRGLVAIEVKHRNAIVYVNGDKWRFVKFDGGNNLVKQGVITDRRGRSPSRQLKEPVAELEWFLAKRGQSISAEPVVILSHPRAACGYCKNSDVHVVLDAREIIALIKESRVSLDSARRSKIEQLIVKDHAFHRSRSGGRRRSTPLLDEHS